MLSDRRSVNSMGGICRVRSATKSLPMEMSLIIPLLLKTESTFSPQDLSSCCHFSKNLVSRLFVQAVLYVSCQHHCCLLILSACY